MKPSTNGANFAEHLANRARLSPGRPALHVPDGRRGDKFGYRTISIAELDFAVEALAGSFVASGMSAGTRVAIMVPPSAEFFTLTFALLRAGLVPIFIDPGMGLKGLKRCLAEAAPEVFIGSPKAHLARVLLGWAKDSVRVCLHTGLSSIPFGEWSMARWQKRNQSTGNIANRECDIAAVAFTSGSTGSPKGVVYRHRQLIAQMEALQATFAFEEGEVDLCTFPLFGLMAPALGISSVIPRMDFTRPGKAPAPLLFELIQRFSCTNLFGSPALLMALTRYGWNKQLKLPTLKRVISAGAAVQPALMDKVRHLLPPGVHLYSPYGSTEVLPVTVIRSDTVLRETAAASLAGKGLCLGQPLPGVRILIIKVSDEAHPTLTPDLLVKPGVVGEIVVDAAQATTEYLGRPDADRLSKIIDPQSGRTLHRMGDIGYLDCEGRLWFCGRKSQRLLSPDGDIQTDANEAIFYRLENIRRCALVGRGPAGEMTPVLCVETNSRLTRDQRHQLRHEIIAIANAHKQLRNLRQVIFLKKLPVDIRHNSKIFRERLKLKVDALPPFQ